MSRDSLATHLTKGENFSTWKKNAQNLLSGGNEILSDKRLEQIYHQNILTSYNEGKKLAQDSLKGEIYLRYVAINDSRTRAAHRILHGLILPREHPFWEKNYPGRNRFGCRCRADAYTKNELIKKGFKISMSPQALAEFKANLPKNQDRQGEQDELLDLRHIISQKLKVYVDNPHATHRLQGILKELQERSERFKAINGLWNAQDPNQKIQICQTPNYLKAIFNTKAEGIQITAGMIHNHKDKHPEIDSFDYSLIADMLENIDSIYQDEKSNVKYVLLNKLGKWYRLSLKSLIDKEEIWVESLLSSSHREKILKSLKKKKKIYGA